MIVSDRQVIILVSGQAGVGKTTFSTVASNICKGLQFKASIQPFASELKRIAILMGWNRVKDEKGRQFLIDLGQAARRYDENTWARLAYEEMSEVDDFIFVDDWRFENEYNYFKLVEKNSNTKICTVKIIAPSREILKNSPQYQDESERGLDNFNMSLYNYFVDNEGSLEELYEQANSIITNIRKSLVEW